MKDPAFLFYSSDFLTGTMFMTNEQVGLYIRLLCAQHQHNGRIDTNVLRTLCESVTNGLQVFNKFKHDDYGSYSERLLEEMKKRAEKSIKASESVKIRWEREKNKTKKSIYERNTNVIRSEDVNENENINEIKIEKGIVKGKNKNFNFQKTLLEFGANQKLVSDWLEVRKKKKASNTETACKSFLDQVLKSGKTIDEVLWICISRDWKGFQAEWLKAESKPDKFVKDLEGWNEAAREILSEKNVNNGFNSLERG